MTTRVGKCGCNSQCVVLKSNVFDFHTLNATLTHTEMPTIRQNIYIHCKHIHRHEGSTYIILYTR